MLGSARLYANLGSADIERTVDFYEGKLGLPLIERREILPGHPEALFAAGGGVICFEGSGSPAPSGKTPISFEVDDIRAAVAALREQGSHSRNTTCRASRRRRGSRRLGH